MSEVNIYILTFNGENWRGRIIIITTFKIYKIILNKELEIGINTLIYGDLDTPIYKDSKNNSKVINRDEVLDWDNVEVYIYYCRVDGRVYSRLVKI